MPSPCLRLPLNLHPLSPDLLKSFTSQGSLPFYFSLSLSFRYTFYTAVHETFLNADLITFPSHISSLVISPEQYFVDQVRVETHTYASNSACHTGL